MHAACAGAQSFRAVGLTSDGNPSSVLSLRNAFEKGGDNGQMALLDGMDDGSDSDIRAACSVLRSFLLELPQPVIPVDYFLPLLEAASARMPGSPADVSKLESILAPMPSEHWTLLEHILCFLVNASRPFPDPQFRQLLARVWAPCILRASARTMSRFQGKVIDAMAACISALLDERRGDSEGASPSSATQNAPAVGELVSFSGPPSPDILQPTPKESHLISTRAHPNRRHHHHHRQSLRAATATTTRASCATRTGRRAPLGASGFAG